MGIGREEMARKSREDQGGEAEGYRFHGGGG
jgi:hypothetical protein